MHDVSWTTVALQQLAAIWVASSIRASVNIAVDEIDNQLSQDPLSVGESREDDYRILFEWPLVVTYWVDSSKTNVYVASVRSMS
jgi:hypothetical protein